MKAAHSIAAVNPVELSAECVRTTRVLMVVDGRYPATGGAELQARLLSSALAASGHSVRVLAPRLDSSQPLDGYIDGIRVQRLAYPHIKALGAIWLNLRFAAWLIWHQHEFDAIHIHMMHNLAGAAGWFKRWLRPKIVVKVSGAAEFQGGILDPALRHKPVHRILLAGSRRLDAFQCISQYTREVMLRAGYASQRLHLIPNAVDCARFFPSPAEVEPIRAVFVGRHVRVKGLDILLRAWVRVRRHENARLVLAGDGPERAHLMALAQELGVADSVDFPGLVEDIPALLAGAAIYVQSSHHEGLPNAVLEAMAAGLPVVATRISGHEDIVAHGHSGILVPPADPAALADAMQRLIDAPLQRRLFGAAGRDFVARHYAIPVITAQLLRLYQAPSPDGRASGRVLAAP